MSKYSLFCYLGLTVQGVVLVSTAFKLALLVVTVEVSIPQEASLSENVGNSNLVVDDAPLSISTYYIDV